MHTYSITKLRPASLYSPISSRPPDCPTYHRGFAPPIILHMKVHIKQWHGVATWHWTVADELCGICRVAFEGTCPNCRIPGSACPLVMGSTCTHNFHLHCVHQWLEQELSKGLCPMCRQTFVPKFIEGVGSLAEVADLTSLVEGHRNRQERPDEFEEVP